MQAKTEIPPNVVEFTQESLRCERNIVEQFSCLGSTLLTQQDI